MCPEIMLFDEVTSALDPELVGGILQILRDLSARRSMTMIIVTHQMKFAERSSTARCSSTKAISSRTRSPPRCSASPGKPVRGSSWTA